MSLRNSRAENPWAIGVLNVMWLPSQPFWTMVLITIDVLVIWALATTEQTAAAQS
jgi:hypothetical protein